MNPTIKKIIYWGLTAMVAFVFAGSAYGKISGSMPAGFGIDADTFKMLGFIELTSLILFIIPRTGILGTLLLAAYMGGAIATHVEHAQPIGAPIMITAFVWVVALVRFPELTQRILGKSNA